MAYGDESVQALGQPFIAPTTADSLGSTGDAAVIIDVLRPFTVTRIGALITVATVSSGGIVVKFDRRVTTGSDTGRGDGDIGTLTIPTATAAGKIVYKDITPVELNAGDQIVPEVTTAAAGGGAAGDARYFVEGYNRHETAANQSDMIASA